jgi:hypothetical protein
LLRISLIALLLGSVIAQFLVPVFASQAGTRFPEVAYLVVPYSVVAILFIGCGQVALLAIWRLLSLIEGGVLSTRHAVRLLHVITVSAGVATALSAGVLIHMLSFVPGGGGPMIYYVGACVIGGAAFTLVMIAGRGVLESAIANRTELNETI